MDRKVFTAVKLGAEGTFRARIATLNVVDSDGDVTLPGAAPDGKRILISAYGHTSWAGALPVGDAVISSDANAIRVDGKFWLDTETGKAHWLAVKNAGDLGQWSYGYLPADYSTDPADLKAWPGARRVLKRLDIYEASPVLVGAGVNTGTEVVKAAELSIEDYKQVIATLRRGLEVLKATSPLVAPAKPKTKAAGTFAPPHRFTSL